jgi:hypothetical protein
MQKVIEYRSFDTTRKFGVELEVGYEISKARIKRAILRNSAYPVYCAGWTTTKNNNFWHLKDDSTCGKNGWDGKKGIEIASFVASGWQDLLNIEQCVRSVKNIGVKTNKNCGLHVHVDVGDFTTFGVAKLLARWLKIELRMLHAVPRRRASFDGFSKPIMYSTNFYMDRDRSYTPWEFWEMFTPDEGDPWAVDRSVTLNITNYLKSLKWKSWNKPTVEFRWPEGTLCPRDVKNWIRLFVNFVEYSKTQDMPDDICHADLDETLNILGLGHDDDFIVLSPGLHETKTWFLERIIKHYDEYPFLERKRQTERAKEILNDMWNPLKKY